MIKIKRKLYSSSTDDFKKAGLLGMGSVSAAKIAEVLAFNNMNIEPKNAKENELIYNKLKGLANKEGIVLKDAIEVPTGYMSKKLSNANRNRFAKNLKKFKKSLREQGFDYESIIENMRRYVPEKNKENININPINSHNSSALAHELGHAFNTHKVKERGGSLAGKVAHKLYKPEYLPYVGSAAFVNGIHSGIRAEKAKSKGEKESKWNRAKSIAVPLALSTPMLVSEAVASKKGFDLLKKSGASKQLLNESRKSLLNAYGTYLNKTAFDTSKGEIGRYVGKGIGKHLYKKKDDNTSKK